MYRKINRWDGPSFKSPESECHRTLRYECTLESCDSSMPRRHLVDEDLRGLPIPHSCVSRYLCIETGPPFSVYASPRRQEPFTSGLKKSVKHYDKKDLPEENTFSYGYQGPLSYRFKSSLSDDGSYFQDEKKALRVNTGQRPDVMPGTASFLGREKLSDIKLKSQSDAISENGRGKGTSNLLRETPADIVELMIKYKNWSFRQSLKDEAMQAERQKDGHGDTPTDDQEKFEDSDIFLSYETDERSERFRNRPIELSKQTHTELKTSTDELQSNSNPAAAYQLNLENNIDVTPLHKGPAHNKCCNDSPADCGSKGPLPPGFDMDMSLKREKHSKIKKTCDDTSAACGNVKEENVVQGHYTTSGLQTEDIILEAQEGYLIWTQPDGKLSTTFRNGETKENFSLFINPSGCDVRILQLAPSGGHRIILDGQERTKARRTRKYCRNRTNKNLKNYIELQSKDGEVKLSIHVLKDKKIGKDFRLDYETVKEGSC